ncbi:type II toxin-antitoxin system prevent-host-death family antitoxin [Streptomyces sp. NA04227]|uniref:type II toxin-antitoxin system prevent-host-death family antitoxin n=1 Tax=Streptomyces sp. NA04227 TaxID=2742136 RepID=UPI00159017E1|nr:type II toxin-antitoxin system prevent-host-death family antitoxin [Streptomyces sp. NA04227]QKW09223.1 type II toxin-antitoxin system prevent-host-death family antitoxin [Streptomyces sp. NA04227]
MSDLPDAIEEGDLPGLLKAAIHRAEQGGAITITRNGKPVAALVSIADYEAAENAVDAALARRARPDDDGARFSLDELEAEVLEDGEA